MFRAGRRKSAALAVLGAAAPFLHLLFWENFGAVLFAGLETNASNLSALFIAIVISMYGPVLIAAVAFVRMHLKTPPG